MNHRHEWEYSGHIIHSTDASVKGKHHWECDCGADMYSERIAPAGEMKLIETPRRYRNMREQSIRVRERERR